MNEQPEEQFSVGFFLFAVSFFLFGLITLAFIFGGLWSEMAEKGVASLPAALSIFAAFFGWGITGLALRSVKRLWIKRIGYLLIGAAFFWFGSSVLVNSTLPVAPYIVFAALFLCGQNVYWAITLKTNSDPSAVSHC